jgi:hypothetical protein
MSAAVIASYYTRCEGCRDWIMPGDPMVFAPNDKGWLHCECERHPEGWDAEQHIAPEVQKLSVLLAKRETLLRSIYLSDLDPDNLPERIGEALWAAMAAEGTLISLCEDVASEHRGVV